MTTRAIYLTILTAYILSVRDAAAANFTLPTAGRVTFEFVFSDASDSNTMAILSPSVTIAITGCNVTAVTGLTGVRLSSAKQSQRGCRVELDSDPATPGIQGFAAGTTFEFLLCADNNGDNTCDNVWSSNQAN